MEPDTLKDIKVVSNAPEKPLIPQPETQTTYVKDESAPVINDGFFAIESSPLGKKSVIVHEQRKFPCNPEWDISEDKIREEFIYLKLYKQMGIKVPECKLAEINGKTALVLEPFDRVLPINRIDSKDKDLNEQIEHIKIISFLFDNYDQNDNLSRSLIVTNDEKIAIKMSFIPKNNKSTEEERDILTKASELLEANPELANTVSASFKALTPEIILEVVQQSGLSDIKSQKLIWKILYSKEVVGKEIPKNEQKDQLEFDKICEKLDPIIEKNICNKGFITISERASRTTENIDKFINLQGVNEQPKKSARLIIRDAKEQISKITTSKHSEQENIIKTQELLLNISGEIKSLSKTEYLLYKYSIDKISREIRLKLNENLINFSYAIATQIERLNDSISTAMEPKKSSDHDVIGPYIKAPTQNQIEKCVALLSAVKEHHNIYQNISNVALEKFQNRINKLKLRKENLIRFCLLKSNTLASTLSSYYGIKRILETGLLESSLRQKEKGENPFFNSPAGERELLPQLTFATNGAALDYGGTEESSKNTIAVDSHQSAGFIGMYPDIVENAKIDEYSTGNPSYDSELHVFSIEHTDRNHQKGIEINTDKLILMVPEKSKEDWIKFLKKPKKEGGAEKDDSWIEKHLRTYPSQITLNTYIRYFNLQKMIGLTPKLGTFVDLNEQVHLHQNWIDNAYRWQSVDN